MLLVINKKGELMIISRQHPKGGPTLKDFPIDTDRESGAMGYKIGYCPCGCAEPLLIRLGDAEAVANKFGYAIQEYKSWYSKLKPKTPIKHKIIRAMGGRID